MHLWNDITQNVLSLQKHDMEATVRSETPDQYIYNNKFLKASAKYTLNQNSNDMKGLNKMNE